MDDELNVLDELKEMVLENEKLRVCDERGLGFVICWLGIRQAFLGGGGPMTGRQCGDMPMTKDAKDRRRGRWR